MAIATLIASGMVARQGLPRWESRAYRRINDAPDSLAPLAWPPMQAGSLSAPFVVAAATFWRTRRVDPAASFAIAGFAAWLTAKVVKKVVGRGRPFDFDETTNLRLWTETDGSLGFVSGHAAVAFAVAGIARQHGSRPLALGAYGLAVVVCVTRIYVGAHLPLDTVGGAALGVIASETTGPVAGAIESALRTAQSNSPAAIGA